MRLLSVQDALLFRFRLIIPAFFCKNGIMYDRVWQDLADIFLTNVKKSAKSANLLYFVAENLPNRDIVTLSKIDFMSI